MPAVSFFCKELKAYSWTLCVCAVSSNADTVEGLEQCLLFRGLAYTWLRLLDFSGYQLGRQTPAEKKKEKTKRERVGRVVGRPEAAGEWESRMWEGLTEQE